MYSFVSSLFLLQQVNKFVYLKLYLYVAPCPGSSGHVKGGQTGTERFGLVVEDIINAERELYLIKKVLRHVQVAQGICRQDAAEIGVMAYSVHSQAVLHVILLLSHDRGRESGKQRVVLLPETVFKSAGCRVG